MHDPKPSLAEVRKAIGQRLAEERVGLQMSQDDLADKVGKARRSVAAWEAGDSMPGADELALADMHGIDVTYVVTGKRGALLTAEQQMLVSYSKALPRPAMEATLLQVKTLGAYAARSPDLTLTDGAGNFVALELKGHAAIPEDETARSTMTFHGDVQQAIGRDLVTQSNTIHTVKKSAARAPRKPRD